MPHDLNPPGKLRLLGPTVRGETYALVGLIGFAIKHNIDRLTYSRYFDASMSVFGYWAPLGKAARLAHLSSNEKQFLLMLLATSLPFIFVGVVMTVRRLRDAALPIWLVCLFFAPFVNLIFFLVLCILPSKTNNEPLDEAAPWPHVRPLDKLIPRGAFANVLVTTLVTSVVGLGNLYLGVNVMGAYGWGIFVALPFVMGLFSVLMYTYHEPRSLESCMGVSVMPLVILGGAIVALAIEGIICVLMAAPIALCLALFGGCVGYAIQARYWANLPKATFLSAMLVIAPATLLGEHVVAFEPPELVVRSAIEISAPPEQVWKKVIAFAEISPPHELLFRAGVAYPIRAEISGTGVGASRRCIFSTGAFVEPITVWDPPRLLKFTVESNPAPLEEITPYAHIHPPHLQGYFISHGGQFLLTALPGGRTRLEGTTWYQDTMWPTNYWRWWSDYVIHRIHMRVLNHIRETTEASTRAQIAANGSATRVASIQGLAAVSDSRTRW